MLEFCCVQKSKAASEVLDVDRNVLPAQLPPVQDARSSPYGVFDAKKSKAEINASGIGALGTSDGFAPAALALPVVDDSSTLALTTQQRQQQQQQQPQPQQQQAGETTPSSGRSDAELTQDEKDREKRRLQELVKKFTKDAVKGVACQLVQLEDGLKREAMYGIDRSLQHFTLEEHETGRHLKWPIANIVDVYRSEESDLVRSRKETSLTGLSRDDLGRCVLLEYDTGRVGEQREFTLLLEGSVRQKERFFTCMKILKLYSMATPED